MEYTIEAEAYRLNFAIESLCERARVFLSLACKIRCQHGQGAVPTSEDYQGAESDWGKSINTFRVALEAFWKSCEEVEAALDSLPSGVVLRLDAIDKSAWCERLRRALDDIGRDYAFSRPVQAAGTREPADVASVVGTLRRCDVPDWTAILDRFGEAQRDLYALRSTAALSPADPAVSQPRKRQRRRKTERAPLPLTLKQTEAMQIVGECKGNIAEAARRVGITQKSMQERYDAATTKLGRRAVEHKTTQHARDRRGQEALTEDDDRRL